MKESVYRQILNIAFPKAGSDFIQDVIDKTSHKYLNQLLPEYEETLQRHLAKYNDDCYASRRRVREEFPGKLVAQILKTDQWYNNNSCVKCGADREKYPSPDPYLCLGCEKTESARIAGLREEQNLMRDDIEIEGKKAR